MSDALLSFDEIRDKLHARGYSKHHISEEGLSSRDKQTLLEVLRALLAEHDEEVQLREKLLVRNRELEQTLERNKRSRKQDENFSNERDAKLHNAQMQLQSAQAALTEEQVAHRITRDQLTRTRKQMNQIKTAANQYRTSAERQVDRLRERATALTKSGLKALVPDIRIASPSFLIQSSSESSDLQEKSLEETEKRNAALLETCHALKRLALDALIILYQADIRLKKILDVESRDTALRSSRRALLSQTSLEDLELHHIFPPLRPLVTDDTEETHPARQHLARLADNLQSHVAGLSQWAALQHVEQDQHAKRRRTDPSK